MSETFNLRGQILAAESLVLDDVAVTASADELNILDGVTATAAELNQGADQSAQVSMTAGAGVTAVATTIHKVGTQRLGNIIKTEILVDLTDQISNDADADIIGTTGVSHFGRVVTATHGTMFAGVMTCLEAPTGGEVDINLYSADEATGVYAAGGSGIAALTGEVLVVDSAGDWTLGRSVAAALMPGANDYLYFTVGTASTPTAGTYTAGKFLITLYGYDA